MSVPPSALPGYSDRMCVNITSQQCSHMLDHLKAQTNLGLIVFESKLVFPVLPFVAMFRSKEKNQGGGEKQ